MRCNAVCASLDVLRGTPYSRAAACGRNKRMEWKVRRRGARGLVLAVLLLVWLACTSAATAAGIFRVDAASTVPTPDGQTWATAFAEIQAAVDAAFGSGGGEVWVKEGTYTSTTDPVVTMKENVHLYGGFDGTETSRAARNWSTHVTTIDGQNTRRCVIGASDATLDGFTVQNGKATNDGGGMYNDSCSPTVTNCTFSGNTATFGGGGMLNSFGLPTVTNCTFLGNMAHLGGGMCNVAASPTVINCTFSGNTAADLGGGMWNALSSSPIVEICAFSGNTAFSGGGMYNASSSPMVTDCTFSENEASSGGGMYNDYSSSPTVTNCTFSGNTASQDGGGMYNSSSSPMVTDCTFSENEASSGGGMCNDCSSSPTAAHCTFEGNVAVSYSYGGGGIYNHGGSPMVTDCTFSGNTAFSTGGGMYNFESSPTVRACVFAENAASANGGGMYNDESLSLTVSHCEFLRNKASSYDSYGGAMYNSSSSPTVRNCTFVEDTASSGGDMYNSSSSPIVVNCTSWRSEATAVGVYNDESSSLTVTNCVLWGSSTAISGPGSAGVTYSCIQGGHAGAGNIDADPLFWDVLSEDFRLHAGSPCLDRGTAAGAPTTDLRGVARPQGTGVDMGAYEMIEADTDGDGLMDEFETTWSHTDPNDPDSDDDGTNDGDEWFSFRTYHVDASCSSPTPDGESWSTAFSDIQAAVDRAWVRGGGEIWVAQGTYTSTAENVVTLRDKVHLHGGFAGTETSRAERDWSTHVTAIDGENARRGVLGADDATLDGFTVQNGTADTGGGMYNNASCSPMVTNCTFSANTASSSGGGMYNFESSPTVTNCTFTGNAASYDGGGMYNDSSSPTVRNCTFVEDTASSGGDMYNSSSSPIVVNCTSWRSEATAVGVYNDESSSLTVTNCVLWGSSTAISGPGSAGVTYSCIQGGHAGAGNIDADPLFWDVLSEDFRLHAGSPCLDRGTAAGAPTTDLRGVARPQGTGVDMGAYEMIEADTDGDGLMDEFETTWSHTDPNDPDSDDDGTNDGDEWFSFRTYHVDASCSSPTPDGESWSTAFSDIQAAVDRAWVRGGGEIWVAQGTYTSTAENVVTLRDKVHLHGGFAGTETSRAERDWSTHVTAIDGENARRGVLGADDATLDGFTVQNGLANLGGGGMYNASASPTVTNCTFSGNTAGYGGGGMFNESSSPTVVNCTFSSNSASYVGGGMRNYASSSPVVRSCTFSANTAAQNGGGMYNDVSSSPTVSHCIFLGNTAMQNGGGVYNSCSSPTARNCIFSGNVASQNGGGMHNATFSGPTLTNCTFWGNTASDQGSYSGGAISNDASYPTVTNCIVWGNSSGIPSGTATVTYSCVQGGYEGTGNIDADPLCWNVLAGDFRLHATSPCLDSGTSNGAPTTDLRGVARPQGAGVDMGAYEMIEGDTDGDGLMDEFETTWSHTDPNAPDSDDDNISDGSEWFRFRTYYVDASSSSPTPDGQSWATAFSDIQSAVDRAWIRGGGEIWVAQGAYTGTGDNVVTLRSNVHLYGGFGGTESSRASRDWGVYVTAIDGENNRRCVLGANNATLDGFTVQNGKATYGAGMYNFYASPTVIYCTFSGNTTAGGPGGGMYNDFSSPAVSNSTFWGNTAVSYGGGMYNRRYSSPTVSNCTFSGNAANAGGGMCNFGSSSPTLINCTFAENTACGMYHYMSSPVLVNCIVWGNSIVSGDGSAIVAYSCIEGGYAGAGNIDVDPLLGSFGDHGGGVATYSIDDLSPARDSGVHCFLDEGGTLFYEIPGGGGYATADGASYVPTSTENELTTTDARGITRPQGPGIDMGAHEFVPGAEGELLVISPNGGEQWGSGTTQAITWENASGDAGPTVRLGLEKGGEFVDWIVRQTDNDGAYNWIVWTDLEPADDYAVRVQSYTNNTYRDLSNAPFSILPITVRVPNGGETWTMGNVYVVDWVGNPTAIGPDVRVGLHFGTDFLYWINRQIANDGQYFWKAPTDLAPGYGYRIRVQSYGDATIKDLSDAPFTLELPTLLWTSPDFHDELTAGQTYAVTWVCNDMDAVGSDVRIALHKGGAFIDWMMRKTENDGAWDWTVPLGLSPAPSYRLRLQSYTDKNLRAMSPAFTITVP